MNKKSLVMFVVGLLVCGVVVGLIASGDNSNTASDQGEITQDNISAAFEDQDEQSELEQDVDLSESYATYPWADLTNPVLIGLEVNRFTDSSDDTLAIRQRIAEINGDAETIEELEEALTDEQRDELEELGKQLDAKEYSSYLSDDKVNIYVLPEQRQSYLEFRDEYFDTEGNELKEIVDPNNL